MNKITTIHNQTSHTQPAGIGQWLKLVPGYLLAIAGLIWVLHDFRFADLIAQLTRLKWQFALTALACNALGYVCQGWRWKLLLKSFGAISVGRVTQALCAGLFVSEVLPLSLGELARCYLAARWMQARFAMVFPTVLIERLFDGVWIAAGIGLTALFLPLPKDYLIIGDIFGALALLGTGVLVWFLLRRPYVPVATLTTHKGARGFFRQLAKGLYLIGLRRDFYFSFAVSLLFMFVQALTIWLMILSYGLELSFCRAVAVLMLVLIGTSAPGPPGNFGTWQFSCVLGLTLFGVDKSVATGFSLVCYTLLSLLLIAVGFVSLSRSGTTLFQLRRAVSELETA